MSTPDKLFQKFIQELQSSQAEQGVWVDYGDGPERLFIEVAEGATSEQIQMAQNAFAWRFPPSYVLFLRHWNGATLYKDEYRSGYRIFSTDEVVNRNKIWREYELLPEERENNFMVFAETGNGDYWAFLISQPNGQGEYPVIDGDHNLAPHRWRVASHTFYEWLDRLVERQGYWDYSEMTDE